MEFTTLFLVLLGMSAVAFFLGRRRSLALASEGGGIRALHSLPGHYGMLTALWAGVPALVLVFVWGAVESDVITDMVVQGMPESLRSLPEAQLGLVLNDVRNVVAGNFVPAQVTPEIQQAADRFAALSAQSATLRTLFGVGVAVLGLALGWRSVRPRQRARNNVENFYLVMLIACSSIAILTTIGIVLSVLWESIRFFQQVPFTEFLFGLKWSPQTAIRADQVGSSGAFGAVPLFAGTLLISFIALLVAVPIGLMTAIYMSEYAAPKFRSVAKPVLEVLAGVPTVVYGFFAALVIAPLIRGWGEGLGLDVASESALAAGLVMGIMIIPFVSSLSDDVISAVPQAMRDGSLGLGATQSETIRRVIFPAALPGIVGGILLAASRAIGETMIVVMAAGLAANLTANPLEAVTTVTVQIATLLVGDQEFDSAKTLAAFALGLILFIVTLCLNVVALHVVRKYREQYE